MIELKKLENASEMLKAIAHPLRIAIVDMLSNNKTLTVTEIHEALNIEQAVASHHLSILKSKGVLMSVRNGKNSNYKLKYPRLAKIISCIDKCQNDK